MLCKSSAGPEGLRVATKVCLGLGVVPAFRSRENFAPSTSQPCRSHAGVDALLERDFGEGQTMTPGDPSRLQARLCQLRKVGVSVHRPQQLLRQEHYVVQCGGRQKPVESPGDTDSRVLDAMQAAQQAASGRLTNCRHLPWDS